MYDIGACVTHWTTAAKKVWPDAEYVLFDAFDSAAFLYEGYKSHVGVLSDVDGREVRFYQNSRFPGGNSYYREIGSSVADQLFPLASGYVVRSARTLDSVVAEREFPKPDLVKIDVQGAEADVIRGATATLASARYLIVEMQDSVYNDGAPMADTTLPFIESLGWKCIEPKFCDNGPDAYYLFERVDFERDAQV
jgi:FkbM family methyltransferase